MPILRVPWSAQGAPSIPMQVSNPIKDPNRLVRVRTTFSLSVPENIIDLSLIKKLGLISMGQTKVTRKSGRLTKDFYYVNLHLTVGLMGALTEKIRYRGIMVVPAEREIRHGLVLGADLIRRGHLTVNSDGLTFCF